MLLLPVQLLAVDAAVCRVPAAVVDRLALAVVALKQACGVSRVGFDVPELQKATPRVQLLSCTERDRQMLVRIKNKLTAKANEQDQI